AQPRRRGSGDSMHKPPGWSGPAETSSATVTRAAYASLSHFCRKLFFAAPTRALPFLSTALGSHASRLHFCRKLVLAAPTSAFHRSSTRPCTPVVPASLRDCRFRLYEVQRTFLPCFVRPLRVVAAVPVECVGMLGTKEN